MANSPRNLLKIPGGKKFFSANGNKKNGTPKNKLMATIKTVAIYALIGLAVLVFISGLSGNPSSGNEVPLSQILNEVKEKKIEKLVVEGDKVTADYRDSDAAAVSRKEPGASIYEVLKNSNIDPQNVNIEIKDISWQQGWLSIIGTILPIVVMIAFFLLIFRQAKDAGQRIFSFGQSRARLFNKDQPQIKFSDVAGVDEAKKELEEVVDFLKNLGKYKEIGARTPKGVLLVGPPGCGKTLLSRSVAGEAGVPFYFISGDRKSTR